MTPEEIRTGLGRVRINTDREFIWFRFASWWWARQSEEFKESPRLETAYMQDGMFDLPDEELMFQYAVFKMWHGHQNFLVSQ